jgi:hypothetical protein
MRTLLALAVLAPGLLALPATASTHVDLTPSCTQWLTFGPHTGCSVEWTGDEDNGDVFWRTHSAVRFDLAAQIPSGSTVTAVSLTLQVLVFPDASVYEIRELLGAACPGTWSGPGAGLGAPAGAPLFTSFDGVGTVFSPTFSSAAFTQVVQHWVDTPAQNFGLLFAAFPIISEACITQFVLHVDYDTPCPAPVNYCIAAPNSQGPNGAHMSILGSTSVAANDMVLVATGVRPGAPGFFYFGATQQQIPLGNGFSCAGNPLLRLASPNLFANASGQLVRPVNFTVGNALHIQPGSTWNFQVMYRDLAGGGAGFNLTDGLAITFCP